MVAGFEPMSYSLKCRMLAAPLRVRRTSATRAYPGDAAEGCRRAAAVSADSPLPGVSSWNGERVCVLERGGDERVLWED
jgi:hypothetical protein